MKIVALDGYTLNTGDLSWQALEKLGEVQVFDRTESHQLVERAFDAHILLINKTEISAQIIEQLPNLQYIGLMSTGTDAVDLAYANKKEIKVSNIPSYGTMSVAQHTFALLLELTNQVKLHSESVRQGEWSKHIDWCYWKSPLVELAGKTLGIIGYGRIGKAVAKIAEAFQMKIIVHSRRSLQQERSNIEFVTLKKLFTNSDVISLHCPLGQDNKAFINESLLSRMKPSAYLINTSRGALINETDLYNALKNKHLAAAALDVLETEPPQIDNPLFELDNCLITPHNAWGSHEARSRLMDVLVDNVASFLEGKPKNLVEFF